MDATLQLLETWGVAGLLFIFIIWLFKVGFPAAVKTWREEQNAGREHVLAVANKIGEVIQSVSDERAAERLAVFAERQAEREAQNKMTREVLGSLARYGERGES